VSEREKWKNRKVVNMIDEYILLIDEDDMMMMMNMMVNIEMNIEEWFIISQIYIISHIINS
jgi:hypothetical protein